MQAAAAMACPPALVLPFDMLPSSPTATTVAELITVAWLRPTTVAALVARLAIHVAVPRQHPIYSGIRWNGWQYLERGVRD